ncbi:MAG: hypothetical protein QXE21_05765, partial [Candidatus Korarchaeota archaeon]
IIFTYGILKATVLSIVCKSVKECDSLENILVQLKSPKTLDEIETLCKENGIDTLELLRLKDVGLLIPENAKKVSLVYRKAIFQKFSLVGLYVENNGEKTAMMISDYLNDLGLSITNIKIPSNLEGLDGKLKEIDSLSSILLISLDYWSPYILKVLNRKLLEMGYSFVPIYKMMEIGIIGPYISKGTACYECFEQQTLASWGLLSSFSFIRSYLAETQPESKQSGIVINAIKTFLYPKALDNFFGSLAALTVAQLASGNLEVLLNRCIAVDFSSIYIDATRVYSLPTCFHNKLYINLEF